MPSHEQLVRRAFTDTRPYLTKDFQISVRAIAVRQLVGGASGQRVLDLGCGDGTLSLQFLSEASHITLVDISSNMLETAARRTPPEFKHKVEYVNTDLGRYTSGERFDLVLCIGVLAHVDCVREAVAKVASLVAPGGTCVFQITDYGRLPARLLQLYTDLRMRRLYGYQLNHITYGQLVKLAAENGLHPVGQRRFMSYLPGMGRLPNRWLFHYQLWSMRNTLVSKHSTEAIVMFRQSVACAEGKYSDSWQLASPVGGRRGSGEIGAVDVSN